MRRRPCRCRRRSHRQQPRAKAHHQNSAQHARPTPRTRVPQLVEKNESPQNPQQAVRIPQRKRDAQSHVANRKNRQRIRHRPDASRQNRPDQQMPSPLPNRSNRRGPQNQRWHTPPRQKNSNHHDQRNHHRRNPHRHQLRRRLRRPQPCPRRKPRHQPHHLQRPPPRIASRSGHRWPSPISCPCRGAALLCPSLPGRKNSPRTVLAFAPHTRQRLPITESSPTKSTPPPIRSPAPKTAHPSTRKPTSRASLPQSLRPFAAQENTTTSTNQVPSSPRNHQIRVS